MVCSIAVFSTGATWTETVGSVSPLSLEQPTLSRSPAAEAAIVSFRKARPRAAQSPAELKKTAISVWFIRLEGSCQSLQICNRHAESRLAIIVRVAGQGQRILRIHHFENGGFSRLITQRSQSQAIRCHFGGT